MRSLTLTLATRGRPRTLITTLLRTLEQIRGSATRIVVTVDDDDIKTVGARDQIKDPRVIWNVIPRPDTVGEKFNSGCRAVPADVYFTMVDYGPLVNEGFDLNILAGAEIYEDEYVFLTGHKSCVTLSQLHGVTHKLFEKMGGLFCEYFPYWFVDHWFEEIAQRVGRQVFVDVRCDASGRPGTQAKREPYFWGVYYDCLIEERRRIANSIIDAANFVEARARKVALRQNWPLIEEWSATINALLKKDYGEPVDRKDQRYARLRAKAEELVTNMAPSWLLEKGKSLWVATPMYGGQCYGPYANSMMRLARLCERNGTAFHFYTIFNNSHIDSARNVCAHEFLRSGFSHMLFVDADLEFKAEDALELMELDKDIVCGFYPKKRIDWKAVREAVRRGYADEDPEVLAHFIGDMVFTPKLDEDRNEKRSIYDLVRLHEGGTGFMMISRRVFEQIAPLCETYTSNGPDSEHITSFFDARPEQEPYPRHITEDFGFCALARRAGVEIWLAPWINLTHSGYYQFIGNIEALAAVRQPREMKYDQDEVRARPRGTDGGPSGEPWHSGVDGANGGLRAGNGAGGQAFRIQDDVLRSLQDSCGTESSKSH